MSERDIDTIIEEDIDREAGCVAVFYPHLNEFRQSFVGDQSMEFYKGLYAGYKAAAKTAGYMLFSSISYFIAFVMKQEGKYKGDGDPETPKFLLDKPATIEDIRKLAEGQINTNSNLAQSRDFYIGLVSGLMNSHYYLTNMKDFPETKLIHKIAANISSGLVHSGLI